MTTTSRYQRAEARHLRDSHPLPNARAQHFLANQPNQRLKRHINPIEHELEMKYKRQRITVEIPARPAAHQPRPATEVVDAKSHVAGRHPPNPSSRVAPPVATAPTTTSTTTVKPTTKITPIPPPLPPTVSITPASLAPTNHQKKVVSGLKHELHRLQPNPDDTKGQGGRKLRSQEGTRFKSELAAYFPDYDEVIGNDPKENHILNTDTAIIITEADPASENKPTPIPQQSSGSSRKDSQPRSNNLYPVRGYGDNLFTDLWESQVIDFSFLDTGKPLRDALPDSVFEPAHRKAERLERSIRNAEKGRAQHERDQVIRLLEGLQGHDWLRVMGVSGITESKKKQFEPARAHFIKGCQVILGKFRAWAEEEKRMKIKKEKAAAAEADTEQQSEDEDGEGEKQSAKDENEDEDDEVGEETTADDAEEIQDSEAEDTNASDEDGEDAVSDGDPPDLSDVDASIAKQLREEAIAAAKIKIKRSKAAAARGEGLQLAPLREFTSFFSKKYQRDAAMSSSRRKGRMVLAFGHPVPDVPEQDFVLPDEYLTEDTLKVHERRKRRERRGKN